MLGGGEEKIGPGYSVVLLGLSWNWLIEGLSQTGANYPGDILFQPPRVFKYVELPSREGFETPSRGDSRLLIPS